MLRTVESYVVLLSSVRSTVRCVLCLRNEQKKVSVHAHINVYFSQHTEGETQQHKVLLNSEALNNLVTDRFF
ncbi:hypothetical protein GCM10023331_31370 [Algivirga pacifica]|uniref:Secreted protein n=1 Tax=Algivirga pacifica TaxID=1162670 RepID=A0ABP9DG32_9BACT